MEFLVRLELQMFGCADQLVEAQPAEGFCGETSSSYPFLHGWDWRVFQRQSCPATNELLHMMTSDKGAAWKFSSYRQAPSELAQTPKRAVLCLVPVGQSVAAHQGCALHLQLPRASHSSGLGCVLCHHGGSLRL